MNLRQLAQELGTSVAILKRLMPDLFPDHTTGSTYIHPNEVKHARDAWQGKVRQEGERNFARIFGPNGPDFIIFVEESRPQPHRWQATAVETMELWRALRQLLQVINTPDRLTPAWEVTIDPFDGTGNVYIMVTYYGEMKWSDRGPELFDRLLGAVRFLREATK